MAERKKIYWFVLVIIGLFMTILGVVFNGNRKGEAENAVQKACGPEDELMVKAYSLDGMETGNIVPWYSEMEKKYLLFLPDWVFAPEGGAEISFSQEVTVEGKKTAENEKVMLDQAVFSVLYESKEYPMEMVRLSRIPALYIKMDRGRVNLLSSSIENEEEVQVYAVDEKGEPCIQSIGMMHCRGNVTFYLTNKKSYALEFMEDTDCYGMGAARNWVLLANYFDSTSLRNYLTFYMAQQMQMEGTPDAEWTDVFLNGEYQGIYLLCEKVEIGEGRLDIYNMEAEQEARNEKEAVKKSGFSLLDKDHLVVQKGFRLDYAPEDISGGYLLELEAIKERYDMEKSGFMSERGQRVVIKSPKYASVAQVKYISGLYQEFENAICEGEERDFLEYIDLDSFSKKYLIEEVAKNIDAAISSAYLYKPEDGKSDKFFAGPVWDYDRAYGNIGKLDEGMDMRIPEEMYVEEAHYGTKFWHYLCRNPIFKDNVIRIYRDEMLGIINDCIQNQIPMWQTEIKGSANADERRWFGKIEEVETFQELSYEEKVEKMSEFLKERAEYLAGEWGIEMVWPE